MNTAMAAESFIYTLFNERTCYGHTNPIFRLLFYLKTSQKTRLDSHRPNISPLPFIVYSICQQLKWCQIILKLL